MKINQPRIDDTHIDSLWYDGLIAETEHYELYAAGEVRIDRHDKDGNYIGMFDGKSRDGFGEIKDDEDINKIFMSDDYYVDANNWFEVIEKGGDTIGDICDTYDSGISWLKELESTHVSES